MSKNLIQSIRGFKDLYGISYEKLDLIRTISSNLAKQFSFQPIELPILEYSDLFYKTLGDASDVIEKELFEFKDKGNNDVALRPEFTTGVMRHYLENKVYKSNTLRKYFSVGPVFRYNRPQSGRYRQFYQLNFENIGYNDLFFDAEIICLAYSILKQLNISCFVLELNSLGCNESKARFKIVLKEYFEKYRSSLSTANQKKLDKNPIAVLDSKNPDDRELILGSPKIENSYTNAALAYFEKIQNYLSLMKVPFKINPFLVRGLDYYSNVIFEFVDTSENSQQNSLLGGGRYDGLAADLGYQPIASVGFAGGIERIANLIDIPDANIAYTKNSCVVIPLIKSAIDQTIFITQNLRKRDFSVNIDLEYNAKKALKTAVKSKIKFAIFIGQEELNSNLFSVKNLETTSEQKLPFEQLISFLTQ